MRAVSDRLSVRWYLGYDLQEPLPEHSSLTRIRDRLGLEVFRSFFERVVEECIEAGLVWGEELFFDATKVEANAAPRRAPPTNLIALPLETVPLASPLGKLVERGRYGGATRVGVRRRRVGE